MKFGCGILLMTAPLLIAGCVSTSATQLSRNQVMISTSAAPVCGVTGAQQVASKMAAVETLRRGYERFIIQGMQAQNNVRTTQRAPTGSFTTGTFNTYGNTTYGMANTSYTGGGVMISGSNDASLVVTMMNRGEPGFQNGVDAKGVLGQDWENLVENGIKTCG